MLRHKECLLRDASVFYAIGFEDGYRYPKTLFKTFLFKTFRDIPRSFLRHSKPFLSYFLEILIIKRFQDMPRRF